jgi:hypothetical protein
MATLTTQNTWHGNPRGTVAYADTAYVNSVTSPYIHIPSGGSASTVPTYVSRQGPSPMVLTADAGLVGSLPQTTNTGPLYSIFLVPTGVWAKGTTFTITATNVAGDKTETLVVTIPQNTTQDTIASVLETEIKNSESGFGVVASSGNMFVSRWFFDGPTNIIAVFTALTITAP